LLRFFSGLDCCTCLRRCNTGNLRYLFSGCWVNYSKGFTLLTRNPLTIYVCLGSQQPGISQLDSHLDSPEHLKLLQLRWLLYSILTR
jgi:hypothetical protein